MRKSIIFTIICSVLLLGGCGKVSTSSPPVTEQKDQQQEQKVDEKLAHRFEQRGFKVEGMATSISADEESSEGEAVQQTAAEKMAKQGTWTMVKLVMNEEAKALFNEQTVQYFEEDINENYPPPKKNTIDAVATVIYENNDSFILDGILRNGFHEQSFTIEQLKPLVFKLVTANNQPWILTTLGQIEGVNGLKGKEAVPFRLVIPKEKVNILEFDHLQFSYHAVVEQPKEKENKKEE